MAVIGSLELGSLLAAVLDGVLMRCGKADEASLSARNAITLTKNYIGAIKGGGAHDRARQESVASAWGEAASKIRSIDRGLEREFSKFGEFWSYFDEKSYSEERLREYVDSLFREIGDHQLSIPTKPKGGIIA